MPRIAVVVLDTLRKDYFDAHFEWLPGTRFERAYATSHYTVPSHASLFTGRYPSETGTHAKSHVFDPMEPALSERLRSAGYATNAFSANVQVSRQFNWDRGFDRFEGSWKSRHANATDDVFEWNAFIRNHRDEGPQRYAKAIARCITGDCATLKSLKHGLEIKYRTHAATDDGAKEALRLVRRTEYPDDAFLFVNLMEAHAPYSPPAEYRTVGEFDRPGFAESVRDDPVDVGRAERTRQAYDDAVRYLSDSYRDIFEELRRDFDYVITLSDHGELLGENGLWGHGFGLYPELTHVPLVVSGLESSSDRYEPVSILDVHRTVLSLAGIDETYGARGRDLTSGADPRPVLTEYLGLNVWRKRKLETAGRGGELETYQQPLNGIATSTDYYGFETFDGFEESGSSELDDPRQRMRDLVERLDYEENERVTEVSDSVMASLEDLGYA